jgi:hypothetical protein
LALEVQRGAMPGAPGAKIFWVTILIPCCFALIYRMGGGHFAQRAAEEGRARGADEERCAEENHGINALAPSRDQYTSCNRSHNANSSGVSAASRPLLMMSVQVLPGQLCLSADRAIFLFLGV